ncbi:carboxypeptidase-like regulatory domain-containing protein [[Muricauda] lutisoli]|uniref:Carboxypeptidase regulatory-like domain-containing protein n=1 Tax=[Muricauda] lutisoli TaxID=2816035 RepID=A0ABS3EUZ4_9FLAO|nr:carboxypeptidase-like regulatory domain-containing protein [[Muricauda] lutisoli]MBO0329771.1 carboxypeptidase regulatory-like domain-containing protein [[Muricauda] lutisoli]
MLRTLIFAVSLILHSLHFYSQERVSGHVLDFNKNPVVGANIVVANEQEKILVYGFANNRGFFSVDFPKDIPSKVLVIVSGLGFETSQHIINIEPNKSEYQITFILNEKVEHLDEVTLKPNEKIYRTGNVTKINVDAFKDGTEQTIEDILRELPGIEILQDGSIKAHGRFISKLLVEGDDLFDDKYKVLSKNLDAKILDEVEIIDQFESNPVLSKVTESENVALNLILKDEYKNVWFGNVGLGLGNNDRIKSSANIGLIKKKVKFFYLGGYNNLGQTGTGQTGNASKTININTLVQEKRVESSLSPIYEVAPIRINQMDEKDIVLNNASLNSISLVCNLNSELKIRGTGIFANDIEDQMIFKETLFTTGQELFRYTENQHTSFEKSNATGELELQYYPREEAYYKNLVKFNSSPQYTEMLNGFNGNDVQQDLTNYDTSFYNHFDSSHLLWNKHLMHNYAYFGMQSIGHNGRLISPTLYNLLADGEVGEVHHISDGFSKIYGVISKLIFNQKKYKQSLELENQKKKVTRENQFIVNKNHQGAHIDSLENHITFDSNKFQASFNSSFDISEHLRVKTEFSIEHLNINFDQSFFSKWMLIPKIILRIRNTSIGSFGLDYQRDFTEPLLDYFLMNFQLTGYQSFKKGVDFINVPRKNQFSFHYQIANKIKTQQLTLKSKFKRNEAEYAQNIQIDESIILKGYDFVKGGTNFTTTLDYTSFFKKLNFSSNLGANINWSKLPYKLNTSNFSNLGLFSKGINISGTTYFEFPVNLDFDFSSNWTRSNYNGIVSYSNWINLSANLLLKINKEISGSFSNKYLKMPNATYFSEDFDVHYTPQNSKFSYQIMGNNIANQRIFTILNIDEYSTTSTQIKLIPRYILASIKYRF